MGSRNEALRTVILFPTTTISDTRIKTSRLQTTKLSTFSPPPSPPILIISSCSYKLSLSPLFPFAFRILFTCFSYAARLEIRSTLYITWTPTSATIWLAGQSRDAPYAISALLRQATSTPFAPFIGASPSRRPIPHHLPKVKYLQPRIVQDVRELNASCCIFFYSRPYYYTQYTLHVCFRQLKCGSMSPAYVAAIVREVTCNIYLSCPAIGLNKI